MADREWFRTDPSPDGAEYPNLESAQRAAAELAAAGAAPDGVLVVRCTASVVQRYTRKVTVTAEDVRSTF
jgi:hypothetical protein